MVQSNTFLWASGCALYCVYSQVVSEQFSKLIKGQLVYCHKFLCTYVMCMQVRMREVKRFMHVCAYVYTYDVCVYKQVYINTKLVFHPCPQNLIQVGRFYLCYPKSASL